MTKTWATYVRVQGGYCQAVTCRNFVKTIDPHLAFGTPEEALTPAERHHAAAVRIRDRHHRHPGIFGACVILEIPTVLVFTALALIDDVAARTRLMSAGIAGGTVLVLGLIAVRRDIPEEVARYLDAAKVRKS